MRLYLLALATVLILQGQDENGKQVFVTHCAQCHGPEGEGGRGPRIAAPRLSRAPDDAALADLIRKGVPGSEMPGTSSSIVTDSDLHDMITYIRALGKRPEEHVPGDPARGKALYAGKAGCGACHSIAGEGAAIGPDLGDAGAKRSAAYLRAKLLDPRAVTMEGFLFVRAVGVNGHTVVGVRLNEDPFSVQIRDLAGRVHSFWKSDLSALKPDPGKTPMPSSRGRLNDEELRDLVAYLASLKGGR